MKEKNSENQKTIRRIPNKKTTPKPPKFNFMWIYAIAVIGLLVVPYFFGGSGGKPINFQTFESGMLKKGDVEKIVAYKNGDLVVAEVYIKKDSLSKPQYANVRDKRSFNMANDNAQFYFTDASYESLKQSVLAAQKDVPDAQKIQPAFEQHESIFSSWLVQTLIMVALFAGMWMLIMRKMGGGAGGGPGGQIFN
ncbi:MAG: peptidase M41, partial [Sphingobacteriaceae bacterium]